MAIPGTNFQGLPVAIGLTGDEIVPIVQGGTDKRTTTQGIANLAFSSSQAIQAALNSITTTQGAILYRGASEWLPLLPSTDGYVLTTKGPAADPVWDANLAADITVGSTIVTGGTNTNILYNNSGVLGEYTLTGTGTVVAMQTAPSFLTSIAIGDSTIAAEAANVLGQRNGTNPQTFRVYNTYANGGTDYERLGLYWSGNVAFLQGQNGGTGVARPLVIDGGSDVYFRVGGAQGWRLNSSRNLLCEDDNTYDIGASGANRPRNIYAGSGVLADDSAGFIFNSAPSSRKIWRGANEGLVAVITNVGQDTGNFAVLQENLTVGGIKVQHGIGFYGGGNLSTNVDTQLWRDSAADTLAQRRGTNAQTFRVYNTYANGGTDYERGIINWSSNRLNIGMEAGGTGAVRAVDFVGPDFSFRAAPGGTTYWQITGAGVLQAGTDNTYDIGASGANRPRTGYFGTSIVVATAGVQLTGTSVISAADGEHSWSSRTKMLSPSDGVLVLQNNAQNDFGRLQFGGTTSSFPALKRSGSELLVRLADDSADANLNAAVFTATTRVVSGDVRGSGTPGYFIDNSQGMIAVTQFVGFSATSATNAPSAVIRFGSGSPEGAVTAPTGSLYLNTAGGTDTTLYTKNSGSGNTGWVAVDNV